MNMEQGTVISGLIAILLNWSALFLVVEQAVVVIKRGVRRGVAISAPRRQLLEAIALLFGCTRAWKVLSATSTIAKLAMYMSL